MTLSPQGSAVPSTVADDVARATLSVTGVTRMHTGSFGEVATYLPGRRVEGVRLRPGATEVHVVLHPRAHVMDTARAVRSAVIALTGGEVDVYVQDLGEDDPAPPPALGDIDPGT